MKSGEIRLWRCSENMLFSYSASSRIQGAYRLAATVSARMLERVFPNSFANRIPDVAKRLLQPCCENSTLPHVVLLLT